MLESISMSSGLGEQGTPLSYELVAMSVDVGTGAWGMAMAGLRVVRSRPVSSSKRTFL